MLLDGLIVLDKINVEIKFFYIVGIVEKIWKICNGVFIVKCLNV